MSSGLGPFFICDVPFSVLSQLRRLPRKSGLVLRGWLWPGGTMPSFHSNMTKKTSQTSTKAKQPYPNPTHPNFAQLFIVKNQLVYHQHPTNINTNPTKKTKQTIVHPGPSLPVGLLGSVLPQPRQRHLLQRRQRRWSMSMATPRASKNCRMVSS